MSYIIPRRLRVERVLCRQHSGGDHDAEEDHVAEVGVVAQPVAPLSQEVGGGEDEEAVLRGHRLRLGRHRRRLPLVGELLLLVVLLFTRHLQGSSSEKMVAPSLVLVCDWFTLVDKCGSA